MLRINYRSGVQKSVTVDLRLNFIKKLYRIDDPTELKNILMRIPRPRYLLDELKYFVLFAYNIFGPDIELQISFESRLNIIKVIVWVDRPPAVLIHEMNLLHRRYAKLITRITRYLLYIVKQKEVRKNDRKVFFT